MSSSLSSFSFVELQNPPLSAFTRLSYPTPSSALDFFPQYGHYDRGWMDVSFVLGWTVLFALAREIIMRCVFSPFMRWWLLREEEQRAALRKKRSNKRNRAQQERVREKKVTRFAEQGWSFVYYTVYWVFGTYIHNRSPYYPFNLDHLWVGYPSTHFPIPGPVKFYYLTQLAFWFNQLAILNIEEKRKDYLQMLCHHIVTTILITTSYFMNLTRVGCLILVLLDFGDILLPLAKMFKYMSLPILPDVTFVFFLITWLVTRQIMFTLILRSVLNDAPRILDLKWDPPSGFYLSPTVWSGFVLMLGTLLVLLCIWFWMIARVAYGVVRGKPAEDTRSDDEDDSEDPSESSRRGLSKKDQ